MPKTHLRIALLMLLVASACALLLPSCGSQQEDTGTETHWLKTCDADADCNGPTSCLCGVCTIKCEQDNNCPDQAPRCLESNEGSCAGSASESICLDAPSEPSKTDASSVEPGASDASEPFSWNSYIEVMCNFYTSCSADLKGMYGTREHCLGYTEQLYQLDTTRLPNFSGPGWDAECLANLQRFDCPQGVDTNDEFAIQQHLISAVFACATPELMPCNDNDDCFDMWECSATDGSCGSCQRSAPGTCGNAFECSVGDRCINGVCGPGKPEGSACNVPQECQGDRCTDVCVSTQPKGGSCTVTTDCGSYLWCNQGVCSSPAAPGQPCAETLEDMVTSCQIGYICDEGRCQELGFSDVAVGEPCLYSGACIAGAECLDAVCIQSIDKCIDDNQCPPMQYCDEECLPRVANGEKCNGSNACLSGYCSDDGICEDGNPCD